MAGDFKRAIAYKVKIGDIFKGKHVLDGERFNFIELGDKNISRVNVIANVVEKYESGEKQYISLTVDDASGQIRIKIFGEDVNKFRGVSQGDSILIIGFLRKYNDELYITPEIIRKQDPRYLMVRKLELANSNISEAPNNKTIALSDKIANRIRESEPNGILSETLILEMHESPDLINQEVKKALEQGIIYEPRPGILRWLGS
ncbi:MAG: OB-fold nucleic acid binding domain-containing protein [Candidatus Pacearchaeota archaeon]